MKWFKDIKNVITIITGQKYNLNKKRPKIMGKIIMQPNLFHFWQKKILQADGRNYLI